MQRKDTRYSYLFMRNVRDPIDFSTLTPPPRYSSAPPFSFSRDSTDEQSGPSRQKSKMRDDQFHGREPWFKYEISEWWGGFLHVEVIKKINKWILILCINNGNIETCSRIETFIILLNEWSCQKIVLKEVWLWLTCATCDTWLYKVWV